MRRFSTLAILLSSVAPAALSAPTPRLIEQKAIVLQVQPMTATAVDGPEDGRFPIRVDPDGVGSVTIELNWPEGQISVATFTAEPRPPRSGAPDVVLLDGTLAVPNRPLVKARREIAFDGSTTALFEIDRAGGRPLTFAIEAEVVRQQRIAALAPVGAPVQFGLEILWVDGGRGVPLESNHLNTFVGQSVSYAFNLGNSPEAQALSVTLTPTRLYGELVSVEMELSGQVPDGDKIRVLSRREEWLASRNTGSRIDVVHGEPPTGFRFVVTPRF